jgi:hypothetical protein
LGRKAMANPSRECTVVSGRYFSCAVYFVHKPNFRLGVVTEVLVVLTGNTEE